MNDICSEAIDPSTFTKYKRNIVILSNRRLKTCCLYFLLDPGGYNLNRFTGKFESSIFFPCKQPFFCRFDLWLDDVTPRGRKTIYRRQNDVQRKAQKHQVKIPTVINIKKPERAENYLFCRRQRNVISVKTLNVLLKDQHAGHGQNNEYAKLKNTEPNGADKIQHPIKYRSGFSSYNWAGFD